ncbi:Glycosyl transferase family 2 [Alkalithermobacter thermoalcaliphilus JW-YL-7 = DSM 7308]|uniref:Glycosyl transferase family 2 n=1 Tax=Alkalithermobacter thermoalcaliphilus JW-YL-7 = DSM 7308 TaxID=1121328 RepID=A0A150FR12_CLOPD|nr:glycosyl transferase family 2 [[Clostridium] paradoxum JW-YL-7 = DSM 7308]SHK65758.1 Glycosyl transferase family 2 [[Clostridium] paradoxum JW-YL-7 = DSM 7308]
MEKNISIIIPAYNEESRIEKTLDGLKDIKLINQIILVDDGSSDKTYELASKYEFVKAYKLPKNMGKGYALNYGLSKALEKSDIIGFLDADLKETSREVEKLIIPILTEDIDVTIAKFPKAKRKGGFGLVKKLARYGVKYLTGEDIQSSLSGQRVFKKQVLMEFEKIPFGYGVEVGMTIDILRKGYKIKEVEVNMTHNETGRNLKGFIHRGKQFMHILLILISRILKR